MGTVDTSDQCSTSTHDKMVREFDRLAAERWWQVCRYPYVERVCNRGSFGVRGQSTMRIIATAGLTGFRLARLEHQIDSKYTRGA